MKTAVFLIASLISSLSFAAKNPGKPAPDQIITNDITITIAPSGDLFFDMSNEGVRSAALDEMLKKHSVKLTPAEKEKFRSAGAFNCSVTELSSWLQIKPAKRIEFHGAKRLKNSSSGEMELISWLTTASVAAKSMAGPYADTYLYEALKPVFSLYIREGAPQSEVLTVIAALKQNGFVTENEVMPSATEDKKYTLIENPGTHDTRPQEMSNPPASYLVLDESAEFPGGKAALDKYLRENLIYPARAREEGIEGRTYLKFIVSEEGVISDIQIARGLAGCPECDAEATRLVKNMPGWTPGKRNGKAMKSIFTLPVKFSLQ